MKPIAELREAARGHARELDAVLWLSVSDLVARWGVDADSVRSIPRTALPYLELGKGHRRRFDPRDVEAYELSAKQGTAA